MSEKLTLKVFPKGWGREAYRVFEISDTQTLEDLCYRILACFDFDADHMYAFYMDNVPYSRTAAYSCDGFRSVSAAKLSLFHLLKGQKFILHYDFGDDWMFMINVQKVEPSDGKEKFKLIRSKGSVEQYPDWDEE